jgi:glycosyltransferase involved in cell wall biosynthesis
MTTMTGQRQLRVVHLSVVHRPGEPRIFDRECRTLAEAGYDVTFLVPGAPAGDANDNPRQVALPVRGRSTRWLSVYEIASYLRHLRPHVLHIHDPELLTVMPAARAFVPRIVYDMHEFLPEQVASKAYIPKQLRPSASLLTAVAQRTLAQACHGVISAAPLQLRALGSRPALRTTLLNYPRYSRFASATPRSELLADGRLKFIHIGGLSQHRGLFLMLDVMAALATDEPASLYLGGRFADPKDELLVHERLRADSTLASRVTLLGPVDPFDVPGYLAAADVAWSPFLGGPQYSLPNIPTKVFEGMAAGLAVLVSDLANHAEPVLATNCGLGVPVSFAGHLAGVRRLLADRDEVRRMGERGRKAVRERYSWEAIEAELVAFYARLCHGLEGQVTT